MSEQLQRLHKYLLDMLSRAKGQRLPRSRFRPKAADRKALSVDDAAVDQARDLLVREGYVAAKTRGTATSYQLLDRGVKYVATLPAEDASPLARPDHVNEAVLPAQKAFVLLTLFRAPDRTLTGGKLNGRLKTQAAMLRLGFARIPAEVPENFEPLVDADAVRWIVEQLARQGAVSKRAAGAGAKYTLTEAGMELLAATEQYDSEDVPCGLSLRHLNELLAAARHAPLTETPVPSEERQAETPVEGTAASPAATRTDCEPTAVATLTQGMVLEAFDALRRDARFSRDAIVPVYELRRYLAARHGPEAGAHAALDPLLFQLRREKRLRMVSIGDLSQASREQLDESVPGENETFFYLEAAREYAPVP